MSTNSKIREIVEWIAAGFGFLALAVLLIAIISGLALLFLHI